MWSLHVREPSRWQVLDYRMLFFIKDLLFAQKQLRFPNESTTEFEQTQEGINFFIKE